MHRPLAAAAALLALTVVPGAPAFAQPRPFPQTVLSRGAVDAVRAAPMPRAQHAVFGTIVALRPRTFTLQTRTGRTIAVDASTAIRNETYSAPLFVGKTVVVAGSYVRNVLNAVTVTRVPAIEAATPGDR